VLKLRWQLRNGNCDSIIDRPPTEWLFIQIGIMESGGKWLIPEDAWNFTKGL
jgi:hypothetical protein